MTAKTWGLVSRALPAAVLVASCWGAASLDLAAGGALSLASGFLAAILILLEGPSRWIAAGVALLGQTALAFLNGAGLAGALAGDLRSLAVATVAALLALRFCGARRRRLSLRVLGLIVVAAIVPAGVIAGAGDAVMKGAAAGSSFLDPWATSAFRDGLGLAVVLPAALLLAKSPRYGDFRRSMIEAAALLAALGGLTLAIFFAPGASRFFLIFPAVTFVALRLGPRGAALGAFLVAAIAILGALMGHGPAALDPRLGLAGRLGLTLIFAAAVHFTALTAGGAQADRTRLWRLLTARDRAARAAAARARKAESELAEMALEPIDEVDREPSLSTVPIQA